MLFEQNCRRSNPLPTKLFTGSDRMAREILGFRISSRPFAKGAPFRTVQDKRNPTLKQAARFGCLFHFILGRLAVPAALQLRD